MGNVEDPEELNGQINRYTTSGFKNSDEYNVIKAVLENQKNLNGSFLIGSDWILPVYFGRQKKSVIDKARRGNLTSFKQNYLCEWVGATDGALMNISVLMRNRTLERPKFIHEKSRNKSNNNAEYIISVDVARSESDSNNKSAIVILEVIRSKKGEVRQVQQCNLITPPNGLTFDEQAVIVKRLFYDYGGDIESYEKSRVKAIVIDANVIGQGLVDAMVKETTDPETNKELGSFGTMNTNQEAEDYGAVEFLYCLKSQGINGAIISNFLSYCESNKFKMLKQFASIQDTVKDEERLEIEIACKQVDSFIDEVANLKLIKNKQGLSLKQMIRKIDKDRVSAIEYGLYYIDEFMNNSDYEEEDDEEDLVWF